MVSAYRGRGCMGTVQQRRLRRPVARCCPGHVPGHRCSWRKLTHPALDRERMGRSFALPGLQGRRWRPLWAVGLPKQPLAAAVRPWPALRASGGQSRRGGAHVGTAPRSRPIPHQGPANVTAGTTWCPKTMSTWSTRDRRQWRCRRLRHAAAAPPSPAMNSRLLIGSPRRRWPTAFRGW
jgi:hypothetical protein